MSIAPDDYIENMTPVEFEYTVWDYIARLGKDLKDFSVAHDVRLVGSDGVYQIDVLAGYTAIGVKMLVLIECKHYKSPVPREEVQILHDKIRSIGAHKAILFSTAGFQSGAVEYALRHKIALIRMLHNRFENITNSIKEKPKLPLAASRPVIIGEFINASATFFIKPGKLSALMDYLLADD